MIHITEKDRSAAVKISLCFLITGLINLAEAPDSLIISCVIIGIAIVLGAITVFSYHHDNQERNKVYDPKDLQSNHKGE